MILPMFMFLSAVLTGFPLLIFGWKPKPYSTDVFKFGGIFAVIYSILTVLILQTQGREIYVSWVGIIVAVSSGAFLATALVYYFSPKEN